MFSLSKTTLVNKEMLSSKNKKQPLIFISACSFWKLNARGVTRSVSGGGWLTQKKWRGGMLGSFAFFVTIRGAYAYCQINNFRFESRAIVESDRYLFPLNYFLSQN